MGEGDGEKGREKLSAREKQRRKVEEAKRTKWRKRTGTRRKTQLFGSSLLTVFFLEKNSYSDFFNLFKKNKEHEIAK